MSAVLHDPDLPLDAWGHERAEAVKAAFYEFLDHVQISSKEKGWMILGEHLYDGQRRVLDEIFDGLAVGVHDFKILKSRQLGISTIIRALMLFWTGIFSGVTGSLVFDSSQHLDEARRELVSMLERLPDDYQFPRKGVDNRYSVALRNGSRVNLASAGLKETKSSGALGRGSGVSLAHRSELCSYGNTSGMEAWRQSLARTNPNRLFIDESTARGPNIWKEIWDEAANDNRVRRIFVGWWSHPDQVLHDTDPDWARYGPFPPSELEIVRIKAVHDLYGHTITAAQLAWIRREMDPSAEQDGDTPPEFEGDNLRKQEQPWCVTAETRVGTNAGIIRIDQARAYMQGTLGLIYRAGPTGKARIWRATTKLGYQVRGTANHPLIDWSGEEIRLDQSLGKRVRLTAPKTNDDECKVGWTEGPIQLSLPVTPDFARLIGLFMGDGSLQRAPKSGGGGYFKITCDRKDQDLIAECKRLILDVWGVEPNIKQQKTKCDDVIVGSRFIVETFKKLGLSRTDTGVTMRKIHVPEFIWRSPKPVIKEFLSGLFEADGFNGYGADRVSLFSKYPEFIKDVQLLLLAFGITSRFSTADKTAGDGHVYKGNQLDLRAAEARRFNSEIGFLSERKRSRSAPPQYRRGWASRKQPSIVLEDVVESVVQEDVEEEVYNVSVDGRHWFDANGIVTHNTADEAFLMTGSVFFDPARLTDQLNKRASRKFKAYTFAFGEEFNYTTAFPSPNARSIHLKVWDEPVEDAIYILSADPAFGHSETSDRSCIQVLRCFSDGLDQVAEYATSLVTTEQFAWAIAAIEGWYAGTTSHVYRIVELNGPGDAVVAALKNLKRQLSMGYFGTKLAEKGLQDIQRNVHTYFYTRTDSMTPGRQRDWKTQSSNKVSIMERLRDFTHSGALWVRSMDTLEEMRTIAREGDTIAAQGNAKDDRVVALAIGLRNWDQDVRRKLIAGKRTREAEEMKRRMTVRDQIAMYNQSMFDQFLAGKQRIHRQQVMAARRASWRSG